MRGVCLNGSGMPGGRDRGRTEMIAVYLSGILRLIKEWHYRSDIHKLQGMSDRQLSDIGLSRSRIEEAVRGGLRDETRPSGQPRTLFHP